MPEMGDIECGGRPIGGWAKVVGAYTLGHCSQVAWPICLVLMKRYLRMFFQASEKVLEQCPGGS